MRHVVILLLVLCSPTALEAQKSKWDYPEPDVEMTAKEGFAIDLASPHLDCYVSMTLDDVGRPFVSVEKGPVFLLHDRDGDGVYETKTVFTDQVTNCQGICFIDGELYAMGNGPENGHGVYRLKDVDGDGKADTLRQIGKFHFGGDHGTHAIVHGPDNHIYAVIGNFARMAETPAPTSPYHSILYEGNALKPYYDPNGHAVWVRAPGGFIVRSDLEGKSWEMWCGGFRNQYDAAFNNEGEFFTFDSDMEWDLGLPWYRPVRVVHLVVGGEYGFRTSSYNQPEHYYDSLPATVNVGRGSPCGVIFYDHTRFPKEYHGAYFLLDWSIGRILVMNPEHRGATYGGVYDEFVTGRPKLNVTDIEVGPDGALYFTTGGWGTTGGIYRVFPKDVPPSKVGAEAEDPVEAAILLPQPWSAWSRRLARELKEKAGEKWEAGLAGIAGDAGRSAAERIRALFLLEKPPEDLLIEAQGKGPAALRAWAAWQSREYGSKKMTQALLGLLDDPDPWIVRRACEALEWHERRVDPRRFYPLLGHEDRFVRFAARTAIERHGAEPLWTLVQNEEDPRRKVEGLLIYARDIADKKKEIAEETVGEWNFDKPEDFWAGEGITLSYTPRGTMVMDCSVDDPSVTTPPFEPAEAPLVVRMRLRSNSKGHGQVFWMGPDHPLPTEVRSVTFGVAHDNKWRDYEIELNIDEEIHRIRVDPGTEAGKIEIDWLKVCRPVLEAPREGARRVLAEARKLLESDPPDDVLLDALRLLQVLAWRPGLRLDEPMKPVAERIAGLFPKGEARLDREMSLILGRWHPEGAVAKLLDEQDREPRREQQIQYAYALRAVAAEDFTTEQKRRLLRWFEESLTWPGGHSYQGYMRFMVRDSIRKVTAEEAARFIRGGDIAIGPNMLTLLVEQLDPATLKAVEEPLRELLKQKRPKPGPEPCAPVVTAAISGLARISGPKGKEWLRELLNQDPGVLEPVISALASYRDPADFELLLGSLDKLDGQPLERVLDALLWTNRASEDPKVFVSLLKAGRRLNDSRSLRVHQVLEKWLGKKIPFHQAWEWRQALEDWESWVSGTYPEMAEAFATDAWSGDQILAYLLRTEASGRVRSLLDGAAVFEKGQCLTCHILGQKGGGLGPELSTLAGRFSTRDILDALLDPSKVISDLYEATMVITEDEMVITGKLVENTPEKLVLLQGDGTRREVLRDEVEEMQRSEKSLMPEALLDPLTMEEIGDLFYFLRAQVASDLEDLGGEPWRPLFNGKDLEGWEGDAKLWKVENGVLVGRAGQIPRNSYLFSKESFRDFVVEFDVKLKGGKGNSGMQFRSKRKPDGDVVGCQADIGEGNWGSLYYIGKGLLAKAKEDEVKKALDPEGWNHCVVIARGDRIQLELNGVRTVDTRFQEDPEGVLAFQLHTGHDMEVRVRNARIKVLK